jgi:ABC-type lipoprotein export system ATPase subunit
MFRQKDAASSASWQNNENDPLIQMQQIVKTFKTPAGDFTALKGIDADFYRGEFVSVVGKSGSGKSTLVNMITGIDRPTSGQVQIGGTLVHTLNESRMARWRGRNLGIVFQFYQLLPMLSLLENVILPMDISGAVPSTRREDRAMDLLRMVGLEPLAHKMPAAVSGGQQQSAAIARALANDPPLIVADEPTGNLDSRAAERVFEIFEGLVGQGKTVIMVTHDNSLAQRASRSLLLADGEIINPVIASSLPMLTHQQMLKATHNLQPRRFEPGATIIRQGEPNDHLYLISKGYIQVTLAQAMGEVTVTRLGPGQFFGEVSMLQHSQAIANVKAESHSPVEVLALGRDIFVELLSEAQALREAVAQLVQERLAENAAIRNTWQWMQGKGAMYAQTALA